LRGRTDVRFTPESGIPSGYPPRREAAIACATGTDKAKEITVGEWPINADKWRSKARR
jgi:hypothetical protein